MTQSAFAALVGALVGAIGILLALMTKSDIEATGMPSLSGGTVQGFMLLAVGALAVSAALAFASFSPREHAARASLAGAEVVITAALATTATDLWTAPAGVVVWTVGALLELGASCQLDSVEVAAVGPFERRLRTIVNPVSTGLTARWWGMRRQVPPRPSPDGGDSPGPGRLQGFHGVASPGCWTVPDGQRPGWDWLPEHGASPNRRAMPWWARVWYWMPFIGRYAYEWMWRHGGWSVWVPGSSTPPTE